MKPIIEAIFANLVGEEDAANIDVIANDTEFSDDGSWKIKVSLLSGKTRAEPLSRTAAETPPSGCVPLQFRHPESGFGHDKSRATAPYRDLANPPTIFFCGDGVSDLSAAKAADLLFVKVIPKYVPSAVSSPRLGASARTNAN